MDRINAFISYSSSQKLVGGRLRACLIDYCGYNTFIAHEDIPGSLIWENEIISAIEKADFFIPLISESFKQSDFTDQETGIAVILKKKIIPIKLESLNPYGFINKYQALQYRTYPDHQRRDNSKELALTIGQIGLSYEPDSTYHQKAISSIIHAFCTSTSFDTTNTAIEVMVMCKDFSTENLNQIAKAVRQNDQIQGAFGLPRLKKFLQITYRFSID